MRDRAFTGDGDREGGHEQAECATEAKGGGVFRCGFCTRWLYFELACAEGSGFLLEGLFCTKSVPAARVGGSRFGRPD